MLKVWLVVSVALSATKEVILEIKRSVIAICLNFIVSWSQIYASFPAHEIPKSRWTETDTVRRKPQKSGNTHNNYCGQIFLVFRIIIRMPEKYYDGNFWLFRWLPLNCWDVQKGEQYCWYGKYETLQHEENDTFEMCWFFMGIFQIAIDPPPHLLLNGQTWKKVLQTILASPYTHGQRGKKCPPPPTGHAHMEATHFKKEHFTHSLEGR